MDCNCDRRQKILDDKKNGLHYDNCRVQWRVTHKDSEYPRNEDGTHKLLNKNLKNLDGDFLYHLGFDTKSYDLPVLFGDVKFVCMGGTKIRMKEFAMMMAETLEPNKELYLPNISKHSHRCAIYKVGNVLFVSHGMGVPSITVILQEVIKLLNYAKAIDPIIIRLGTSGGLGIPPGSVVISLWGLNGTLEKSFNLPILGNIRKIPSFFDQRLAEELASLVTEKDGFKTFKAGTMAADDFYRGQARVDGPFCDHTEDDKMKFLYRLKDMGVSNIEMEATAAAALCGEAAIRAADMCVTYLDRLQGDQITTDKETLMEWQKRPMKILIRYIMKYNSAN